MEPGFEFLELFLVSGFPLEPGMMIPSSGYSSAG